MDLFEKSSSDWESFEQMIEEATNLINTLRKDNETLLKKNKKMEEGKKDLKKIKTKMLKKIKELLDKLDAIKE